MVCAEDPVQRSAQWRYGGWTPCAHVKNFVVAHGNSAEQLVVIAHALVDAVRDHVVHRGIGSHAEPVVSHAGVDGREGWLRHDAKDVFGVRAFADRGYGVVREWRADPHWRRPGTQGIVDRSPPS